MAEKRFIPEFGPNGAVLNTPGMSPERRAELEYGIPMRRPPTPWQLWIQSVSTYGSLISALVFVLSFTDFGRSLLAASLDDIYWVSIGFAVLVWSVSLLRRPEAWRRAMDQNSAGRCPPLPWRIAIDTGHFVFVTSLVTTFWIAFALGAINIADDLPGRLFWLLLVLGIGAVLEAARRVAVRRSGWAIPHWL